MDPDSVSVFSQKGEFYYWACGPEAGTIYYNSILPTAKPGAGYTGYNGAYNNWGANPGQPDAYDNVEVCMQVNWPYDTGAAGQMRWNDLPNDGLPNIDLVKGYFVEFSDYEGGRVEGFTQSANGASTVSIEVAKGDVFNTVKDGGTYYVDTVLTAFDRNITKITVDGSAFTSGGKLEGNMNTAYTIVATDLDDNTAEMTVNMKTIASISEPIKDLTVNNVQMSNKDSILAVKAALMAIDTTDASTEQKTEIDSAVQNCKNLYFALFNAEATALNGTNGWYKNGIDNITLTAPDGFEISTSTTGTWTSSIAVDKADGGNKTAVYYLKETSTGDISSAKTFNYNVDTIAPTGTITIKNNAFKEFINKVSFGLFFKNSVDVSISGTDTLSNPVTILYQKVKDGGLYNEGGTWISGSSFSVMANEKFSVYAKLTDNAGNTTIINSDGVVVYTDSTQGTTDISFIKTSTTDVTATVNLNGNTIKEIKNGDAVLVNVSDYSALDGTITFKASYLDSLAVGTYTLMVSYNPMGEEYVTGTNNQAPATTTLTLAVRAKNLSGEAGSDASASVTISPESMVYSGNEFNPAVTVKDGTKTLIKDTDYTLSWTDDMINAGDKTLTITFKGNYSGVVTKTAAIANADITDNTEKTQTEIYNGSKQTVTVPTGTTMNSQALTVWYSADGSAYNLTSAPVFTTAGTYTVYYELSAPNHNTITGQIAFTINAATDNAISNLSLNGWTFGEKANTPTAAAKYGTPVFTYSNSENGLYTDNIPTAAGTYFVKASVIASDDYNGCEAKTSFVIAAKAIGDKDIAISGINDYYLFTGSAITPEPTVTVSGTVLLKDTDYTVDHENNTQIGTDAKVKVTLKGNYSGIAEKTFKIRYDTKANLPQTGDSSNLPLWIALIFISGGVLITLNIYKKYRKCSAK
jgi:LPXTG-motif cell wall-anchored protein